MMSRTARQTIGLAVRTLRKGAGLSQKELARKAGFEHYQIVSSIERGERALKDTELLGLARVFHVDVNDLLQGITPNTEALVLWRDGSSCTSGDKTESLFLQRCRRYALVERLAKCNEEVAIPDFSFALDTCSFDKVELMAEQVRGFLQLGAIPGPALRDALENTWRIKIFQTVLEKGSAATTCGDFGPAILENAVEPPKRRIFSLAHELFHVLTWKTISSCSVKERNAIQTTNELLANAFASALLLPRGTVLETVSQGSVENLADLLPVAQRFNVSLPALLWRLVNLRFLKQSSVRNFLDPEQWWGSTDPGWRPPTKIERPLPRRYVALAFSAYLKGRMTIGKLAELLETTAGLVERRLAAYGMDLEADAYQAEVFPA